MGYSFRKIAEQFHVNHQTVKNIIDKFNLTGNIINKKNTGRKAKLSIHETRLIHREVTRNPNASGRTIKDSLNLNVNERTVRRTLQNFKKPLLRKVNIRKRLEFARKYVDKPMDFWKRVVWTDESKFELKNAKQRKRVWCEPGKRLQSRYTQATLKHGGGSIMVWGAFSATGVGNLAKIDEKMTGEGYVNILKENLIPSLKKMRIRRYIFMQDNDPKHTSRVATHFFNANNIDKFDWPPQSPDINPIENLWAILDRNISLESRINKTVFWQALQYEWNNIPSKILENLVSSIPNRLKMVITNHGGHIPY